MIWQQTNGLRRLGFLPSELSFPGENTPHFLSRGSHSVNTGTIFAISQVMMQIYFLRAGDFSFVGITTGYLSMIQVRSNRVRAGV